MFYSHEKKILFGAGMAWLNKFTMILTNILVLPFYFRFLDHELLGIWFLLGQGANLAIMLDFGISPILQRKVAFARGEERNNRNTCPLANSKDEVAQILITARALYRRIIVVSFLIMWFGGWYFLKNIDVQKIEPSVLFLSWTVLCFGYATTIFSLLWSSALNGLGHVGWETLISWAANILMQIALVTGVFLGFELLYLAITTALFAVFSRFLVFLTLRRLEPRILSRKSDVDFSIIRGWAPFAFRYWVTSVAAFLLLKTDQAFIAYFLDPASIPQFQAALQVFTALTAIGLALSQASQPFISQSWALGNASDILTMTRRNLLLAIATVTCGASIMLNAGEEFFNIWLGPGQFVGQKLILIFAAITLLETQHMVLSSSSRATNYEGFAFVAIAAALINLILTFILVQDYGLVGIALGTMIAQITTNNWYVVYASIRRLKIPFKQYIHWATLMVVIFTVTIAMSIAIKSIAQFRLSEFSYVLLQISVHAFLYALIVCFFVLSKDERKAISRRLAEQRRS